MWKKLAQSKLFALAIYAVTTIVCAIYALSQLSWDTRLNVASGGDYDTYFDTITIANPWIELVLSYAAMVSIAVLFVASVISLFVPLLRFPFLGLVLAIVLLPVTRIVHIMGNLGPWHVVSEEISAKEDVYQSLYSGFMQGQIFVLGRLESDDIWGRTYKILGQTNGDSPFSWASVIRAGDATEPNRGLYLSPDNILVAMDGEGVCCMTYDLKSSEFSGADEVEQTSPFICLGAKSELNEKDVAKASKLVNEVTKDDFYAPGIPRIKTLREDLNHPNPAAARLAKEWLEILEEKEPPEGPPSSIGYGELFFE